MSETRTVTTRDGFEVEFNAQSDAEARAYKAGWADCLAEIREEEAFAASRRIALAARPSPAHSPTGEKEAE